MRFVVFGLAVSSSWGNGHATLWRGLIRALAARGHAVTFFEKDTPWYAAHRDLAALPAGELVVYRDFGDVEARARKLLAEADVGVVTSYCADAKRASPVVLESRARHVFYDLDAPVTLDAVARGEDVAYLPDEGLGAFDLVLSYTGGRTLAELCALGARKVAPLYGHVDPAVHRPAAPIGATRGRLSYLGTYAADRQAALERLFLAPARALPDARFVLGGSQYPADFPWRPNVFYLRHVAPPEHPAFYASAALTLNVTREPMRARGFCPSARLFEAAACGVPVLSDSWPGLQTFFTPGEEIVLADTTEAAIAAASLSDSELARLASRARERTLAEHTSAHRAEELVRRLSD